MISKLTQYRLYAGTKKGDYSGWSKVEVDRADLVECWSLHLGSGYTFDRVKMKVKRLLGSKVVQRTSIRMDRTIADPDSDYTDLNMHVLFDVNVIVSEDSLKFEAKDKSFVILSRVPVDWKEFENGEPEPEPSDRDNWSSFYS
jgi:hypothetical protein